MSFVREDFYDECKAYIQAIEMLELIETYWQYDLPYSIILAVKIKCYETIEFHEEKYRNRVLRE